MQNYLTPQDNVFWYLKPNTPRKLVTDIKVDVAVIGGGMAGLSAAQAFSEKGASVALLERTYCGSGASGKSSGFITPDSEISLSELVDYYGPEQARALWQFVLSGVNLIRHNIRAHSIDCEQIVEDSLVVANSSHKIKEIEAEHKARQQLNYQSSFYDAHNLKSILATDKYYAGVRYPDTFGINAYLYCQSMKEHLQAKGVEIYEESPVLSIDKSGAKTLHAKVSADQIIVCADRFIPDLNKLKYEIYHAQTFLMLSEPLDDAIIKQIFPKDNFMVWDTDLVYSYYRISAGKRLMLGGGSVLNMYDKYATHDSNYIYKKLTSYFHSKFPKIKLNFEYMWPGLIGLSKDIMPLAGFDNEIENIYYISAAAGLPWAAALGKYAAERIIDKRTDFDKAFSPYRSFPIGGFAQTLLGTKLSFALSNLISLYFKY